MSTRQPSLVNRFLLGSVSTLISVSAGQAADLPVKAKAVEYVKVCSLYGAGFYYIPGTDICMKIGGYFRFQETYGNGGSNTVSNGPAEGTGGRNTRTDSQDWIMRTRAVATFDTRQQTQYGVLRTYLLTGFQQDSTSAPSTAPNVFITRGFIQIAGFTFGKATSYYDFFPRGAVSYHAGNLFMADMSDPQADTGQMVAAFTAQLGAGLSTSISAENSQRKATVFTGVATFATLGGAPTANNLGSAGSTTFPYVSGNPDIVANVRWDNTRGSFQIAGALHDASGGYYGATENLGHPSNKWGWAVSPGLKINTPMIAPGDYFVVAYSYTQGAAQFAASQNSNSKVIWNGQNVAYGFITDGIYGGSVAGGTNTDVQLTTAWSTAAAYEHYWTPALQTSVYGSYLRVSHNDTAKSLICTATQAPTFTANPGACNPDWKMWNIGSRTQWNVTRGLYVGFDVIYAKLYTATPGTRTAGVNTITIAAPQGAKPAATYNVSDQSYLNVGFRVQRDIVP